MEGDGRFAGFRIERELGRGGMGVVYLVAIVMDEYSAWVADATGKVVQLEL